MPGSDFLQSPPHLGNQWLEDGFLQSQLRRLMPDKLRNVEPDLGEAATAAQGGAADTRRVKHRPVAVCPAERFGWQVATRIKILGQAAEVSLPHACVLRCSWLPACS